MISHPARRMSRAPLTRIFTFSATSIQRSVSALQSGGLVSVLWASTGRESSEASREGGSPRLSASLHPNERLAIVEEKVSHMEQELDKVDEMHAILLQAKGVRWAVIAVSGVVGFLAGISHWLIGKT